MPPYSKDRFALREFAAASRPPAPPSALKKDASADAAVEPGCKVRAAQYRRGHFNREPDGNGKARTGKPRLNRVREYVDLLAELHGKPTGKGGGR